MIEHGRVRAAVAPETILVDEKSVWVADDVQEITVQNEQGEQTEYEFSLIQYSKDEYIRRLISANEALERDVANTQLALCEVYEMMI